MRKNGRYIVISFLYLVPVLFVKQCRKNLQLISSLRSTSYNAFAPLVRRTRTDRQSIGDLADCRHRVSGEVGSYPFAIVRLLFALVRLLHLVTICAGFRRGVRPLLALVRRL